MLLTQGAATRLALSAVILYLGAHGVTGRQGLVSYVALQEKEAALKAEKASLDSRIEALKVRADRLRPGTPAFDKDYLEERARALLDAAYAGEEIYDLGARDIASLP